MCSDVEEIREQFFETSSLEDRFYGLWKLFYQTLKILASVLKKREISNIFVSKIIIITFCLNKLKLQFSF